MPKTNSRSFRTQYDKYDISSVTGSSEEPIYSAYYNEKGTLELEVVGVRDVYSEIQSHADSVDINKILKRFAMGETDVLEQVQGFYDDVSSMPKTYQEVLNCVIDAEQFFNKLPVEEKKKFNNSFSEFMVASGNPDFLSNFSADPQAPAEEIVATEEVSTDE